MPRTTPAPPPGATRPASRRAGAPAARTGAPAPARVRGTDTRSRLLHAAIEVLLADGIHALSQAHVAALVGLRQSHLTYYFPTRADLLKAIVEHASAAVLDVLRGGAQTLPPTLRAFRELLVAQITDRRMSRLMFSMAVAADEEPDLDRWMRDFDQGVEQILGDALVHFGVRPSAQDISLFHAALVGIGMMQGWTRDAASARRARRLVGAAFDRLVADGSVKPRRRATRTGVHEAHP